MNLTQVFSLNNWINRKYVWGVGLLAVALSVYAYRATLQVFYVQDDFWFLRAAGTPWPNGFMVGGVLPDYWRPISTYWFHWFNVTLFGVDAVWHHVILLSVFGLTILLWALALYEITGSYLGEFVGALIYGISRLHLYTLGWVSGAIDILAALFLVMTMFLFWRWRNGDVPVCVVVGSLALGLLSKEPIAFVVLLAVFGLVLNAKLRGTYLTILEKRLIYWFLGLGIMYVVGWVLLTGGHRSSVSVGIYWYRGYYLLGNAVAAIVPNLEYREFPPWQWFLFPILLIVGVLSLDKRNGMLGAVWGIGLYFLPVLPFVFFDRPQLQPYYAHFSMLGLSLLFALVLVAVWRQMQLPGLRKVFVGTLVLGMTGFILVSWQAISTGIDLNQSPALFEAQYSDAAYEYVSRYCVPDDGCQKVIFLDMTDLMWWATGKGVMVQVMFPGVQSYCDGYAGYLAPIDAVTTDDVLVLRQVAEKEFQVVYGD